MQAVAVVVEHVESRAYLSAAPALTLINAVTDQPIGAFANGASLDVSAGKQYSVRADVGSAGSVRFFLDGSQIQNENFAPYSIAGDAGSDYNAWVPAAGS